MKSDKGSSAKGKREKPVSLYPLTTAQAFKVLFEVKPDKKKKRQERNKCAAVGLEPTCPGRNHEFNARCLFQFRQTRTRRPLRCNRRGLRFCLSINVLTMRDTYNGNLFIIKSIDNAIAPNAIPSQPRKLCL